MRKLILRILITLSIAGSGAIGGYLSFSHSSQMPKSNLRILLDSGHGSIIDKVYQTHGKQSPTWSGELKIYEGKSTKELAYQLVYKLSANNIDAQILNPELEDISLKERVLRANAIYTRDLRSILISIHHDAQPNYDNADYYDYEGLYGYIENGVNRIDLYTSIGYTKSDVIVKYIQKHLQKSFDIPVNVKECNFYILKYTYCPAILIEFGFMTSLESCKMIADPESRDKFTTSITNAILEYNEIYQ